MVKKWLITGGCGFIGRNLVKHLTNEGGHFIRILDNLKVGTRKDLSNVCSFSELQSNNINEPKDISGMVELLVDDILNTEVTRLICRGFDVIVHLAANTGVAPSVQNPRQDMETNVIGLLNMLESARFNHVGKFIFASSGAPIGECTPPIHEDLPARPVSPYGASKLAGEGYCSAYFHSFGVKTVSLRFGNVYGPLSGHKDSVVAKFIKQALNNEILEIYGDGSQTRDFIFIDDLVNAIKNSVFKDEVGGQNFQIATSSETTVSELASCLINVLNDFGISDIKIKFSEKRVGDVMRNFSDTSKAKAILDWQSEYSLVDGLKLTAKWFIENHFTAF